MSLSVNDIIKVTTNNASSGVSAANFASAVLFSPDGEGGGSAPAVDAYKTYTSLSDFAVDYATTTETYKAGSIWLSGIPSTTTLLVWTVNAGDTDTVATINKARASNLGWWYFSFFTNSVYDELAPYIELLAIAAWHDGNDSYFMNTQFLAANVAKIRDEGDITDVATLMTKQGTRHASTFSNATTEYGGIAVCKWLASVNYSAVNTTITAEYKKLAGISSEDLTGSEYTAMTQATKKCQFYSVVDLQGSTDNGRVVNSWSHSSFGEWMDDIVNLDAFVNSLKVRLYNTLAGQNTKLPQTPAGQAVLLGQCKAVCEQYIANGYLGPRNYINQTTGADAFTLGYEILTQPEDILNLSAAQRSNRESWPIAIDIYRAGAIHTVSVNVNVF